MSEKEFGHFTSIVKDALREIALRLDGTRTTLRYLERMAAEHPNGATDSLGEIRAARKLLLDAAKLLRESAK